MKKLFCLFYTAVLTILTLVGCNAHGSSSPTENASLNVQNPMAYLSVLNAHAGEKKTTNVDLSEIKEGMTLGQAFELLGSAFSDDRNSLYPIEYNWKLDGDKKLYIVFETEDYDEFMKRYENSEFILPDEKVEEGSLGIHYATPNEIKVFSEWLLNYRAICAYVTDGHPTNKTVLFKNTKATSDFDENDYSTEL